MSSPRSARRPQGIDVPRPGTKPSMAARAPPLRDRDLSNPAWDGYADLYGRRQAVRIERERELVKAATTSIEVTYCLNSPGAGAGQEPRTSKTVCTTCATSPTTGAGRAPPAAQSRLPQAIARALQGALPTSPLFRCPRHDPEHPWRLMHHRRTPRAGTRRWMCPPAQKCRSPGSSGLMRPSRQVRGRDRTPPSVRALHHLALRPRTIKWSCPLAGPRFGGDDDSDVADSTAWPNTYPPEGVPFSVGVCTGVRRSSSRFRIR